MTASVPNTFRCNICGGKCDRSEGMFSREAATCGYCDSTVRTRSLAALLSRELFGTGLILPEIPVTKRIRGLGMSDGLHLARQLEEKFDYRNTYYHQEPRFDITRRDPAEEGRYDFVISSEVMEHVPPPVERGFENLSWLLRPGGVLILTVPYETEGQTIEHFPSLHEFALASPGGRTVLLNRRKDGTLESFEDLVFHGGVGSTLEMRVFSEQTLLAMIQAAGFSDVEIAAENFPEFGVDHAEPWSLPIVARKGEPREKNPELAAAYRQACVDLEKLRAYNAEIEIRTDWALALEKQLAERTEWALRLDAEVKEHKRQQAIWQRRSIRYRLNRFLGRS